MAETRQDPAVERATEPPDDVPELWPQGQQVLVRMYGQGVGDCFLLAIPRTRATPAVPATDNGRPVYILIDCGVVAGTPDARDRMARVVRDIRLTTQDESLPPIDGEPPGHLDLLIVTNSHWDHVSGFVEAEEEWNRIRVDALWMAWTERTNGDEVSEAVKGVTDKQRKALAEVADLVQRVDLDDHLGIVLGLASFVTDLPPATESVGAAPGCVVDPIATAKTRVAAEQQVYCEPGEVRPMPGSHANAYVLGPPRDWERLRAVSPRPRAVAMGAAPDAGRRPGPEGNGADADPAAAVRRILEDPSSLNALAMPLLGLAPEGGGAAAKRETLAPADRDAFDRSFPFDRQLRVPLPTAEAAAAAYPDTYAALASYFDETSLWRRIDFDWLAGAVAFTLEANTLINNTSLVLAIELPPAEAGAEQKVLLFVSDAQLGNWVSWDDIPAWTPRDGARPAQRRPDVADLLQRTVFYKVGHHGSHNGTPKAIGVDRMRDDGTLTAFVPVSVDVARDIKGWATMPHPDMLNALSARSGSRVVLPNGSVWGSDNGSVAARRRVGLEVSSHRFPSAGETEEQRQREDPLWVQMAIEY